MVERLGGRACRALTTGTTAACLAFLAAGGSSVPARAMGSGNAYEDVQVAVTYTVYRPDYVAGLPARHIAADAHCPAGTEENLIAAYGKRNGLSFTITEGNPMCSSIGQGMPVLMTTIEGARATVYAYCDAATQKACGAADVARRGGHLTVTLPAITGLRPTIVWIETSGRRHLSARQLVQIAKGLSPVMK